VNGRRTLRQLIAIAARQRIVIDSPVIAEKSWPRDARHGPHPDAPVSINHAGHRTK
jgi:hypothetical protein